MSEQERLDLRAKALECLSEAQFDGQDLRERAEARGRAVEAICALVRAPSPSAIVAALEAAHEAARARVKDNYRMGDVWTALDVGAEIGLKKAIDIVKELS